MTNAGGRSDLTWPHKPHQAGSAPAPATNRDTTVILCHGILPRIELPSQVQYVACFLGFQCNFRCSYCVNSISLDGEGDAGDKRQGLIGKTLTAAQWIQAIDRIVPPDGIPFTLQGGEPTVHKGFYEIVNGACEDAHFDLLTNMSFDPREFIDKVPRWRFKGKMHLNANYPSIRGTYHPTQAKWDEVFQCAKMLTEAGYSVGLYGIRHPEYEEEILARQGEARRAGLYFSTKEYLDDEHGTHKYPEGLDGVRKDAICRTNELLVGPAGGVYRCHAFLYRGLHSEGNILDPDYRMDWGYRHCREFGRCWPCDTKMKLDKHGKPGYASVDIKPVVMGTAL